MKLDVKIGDRIAAVELIERNDEFVTLSIDGELIELDAHLVEPNVYSIIHDFKSHDVEVLDGIKQKEYTVNAMLESFHVQIIDAESKYQMSRGQGTSGEDENSISSPMPGKVVKIMVKVGDEVKAGDTVVVVSAMKMESEYKVKQDRKVVEICVAEGDNIEAHQPLVIVE
jgi:biotin carboxyl carrier protein